MFIINLTYKTELKNVDKFLNAHIDFLNEQYELGHFLASGRKIPRTGGIILSNVESQSELEKIIGKDPFKKNDLADYNLTEFVPSKTCEELKFLMK
ncbi:YciI family protein [Winogradskyella endarachnes]|uniref:GTP cyclohydrolase n=1 Tax=Winogradskyella endarachnes TaxID=2681965 RepID=A0A6L6UCS3_9FLAO|nr:YciI family protein [Winogradskyella endarachnes]MUU78687.1 GTP cyclohydrolase [Winogradskyella endarachnes]